MKNFLLIACTSFFLLTACKSSNNGFTAGIWRGALVTEIGAEIPFNFEVKDTLGKYSIIIMNGSERFNVDEVSRKDDSIHIQMPLFDSEINGVLSDGTIEGVWTKHLPEKDVEMPFFAKANTNWRIKEETVQPLNNISGKWSTVFVSADGKDTSKAIGEFFQNEAKVTGTFLTTTGDYRYLEGVIDGNQLSLSTFDGSHAYLFTAEVKNDSTLANGKFYAGLSYIENFSAVKNDTAKLQDAYSLTYLKKGAKKIDFSFPNLNKKKVSLTDSKFKNKVVVLALFGSWCPNCMDESAYLSKFYDENKDKGVEVLGLAYERTTDFEKSKKSIERLKKRFNINYDLLITGYTNAKGEPAKSLPMLNQVMAFPTMIIIDKKGNVRKIHTGFNGPGTGVHYVEFKVEFEKLINGLLHE